MVVTVKQLIEAADAAVPRITPAKAKALMDQRGALALDVRDAAELATSGMVAGAVHVPRGMLEFRADPESPYHDRRFSKDTTFIVYCASGGRSALAGKLLRDMGYKQVFNLGAFNDWLKEDGLVDRVPVGAIRRPS